ncbi:DegT/DnrJ/EryC1/StrS aminotransferase family protein [Legionella anisa]|uniref:DegT/DnrJ/EryC1/StrS aminotransferase family protein n=1 Tax=Legionella anisa TaxID=28082 RepID=A0AAX0WYG8_9GAMM|nr:DegT/DnrJ/EryC1/StrS aminotransferase family protein [Legionella anisa]AWN72933.1 DegT/DnrJ/EryC1/StrS aminotransferase family protein [Legionella anisa]KTC70613.1 aminotransferase WecE [Legionella anisa]MBN5937204.1 DegT/DnrJ/EryC1/StrS aminotransferase family protein [Legionella anisa]MCW8423744.1 DegT/DnrJ/EryC1/StrS aminotransferase family protein [Legionella anisa]MCW8447264.1 DegT/DnrJ/EryC1/StrS aminotransferase family protein [Legionella anisa]
MLNTDFSPWPCYTELEAEVIQRVLLSNKVNYWTGNECREFEKEFATWANVKYAVALANGTIALDAALQAINLQAGDEVVVTSRGFIASASSIVKNGGIPVFADVDENSQNITAESIRAVLTERTKAIICVHLAGWPCDMDPILDLANELGLFVIEDCAQAHGAKYKGRPVGSLGHIGAWSFCQDKIITTGGEGGMVTTNDHELWSAMWSYEDHGKSYQAIYQSQKQPEFNWVHHGFGTNGRMTELQAAIGRLQLQKMPIWHQQRLANAKRIWHVALGLKGLRVPIIPDDITHAAYKCYVFVDEKQLAPGWKRLRILEEINARGVPCFYGSCSEIYLEKAFDNTNWRPANRLPVAKRLGETSLMFLVHPNLLISEIEKTTQVLKEVMIKATDSPERLGVGNGSAIRAASS